MKLPIEGSAFSLKGPSPVLLHPIFLLFVLLVYTPDLTGQTANAPSPINIEDPKGRDLPPGVPRTVDTNGNVVYINMSFTTAQYRRAAIALALQECNHVAKELSLPEHLPIREMDLTEAMITPFGYNYVQKRIGSVSTKPYVYYFARDNKFSQLCVANYDQACLKYKKDSLPINKIDFASTYQLATQWLAAVSMDVKGLSRDCKVHIAVSPYWNGLERLGQLPKENFVPIYYVWWTSPENESAGLGETAAVELSFPAKGLLQLLVDDPKYILRRPLIFTNMPALFPGPVRIDVFTNFPHAPNR